MKITTLASRLHLSPPTVFSDSDAEQEQALQNLVDLLRRSLRLGYLRTNGLNAPRLINHTFTKY